MKEIRDQITRGHERRAPKIRPGEYLPMPRGLKGESDYLSFLRQVPDGSGSRGFTEAMIQRAKHV
jgi:hypothetical protein